MGENDSRNLRIMIQVKKIMQEEGGAVLFAGEESWKTEGTYPPRGLRSSQKKREIE